MSDNINTAIVAAQKEIKNANLNKTNPHFRSKFADLASVREAVLPTYAKHGIAVIQTSGVAESGFGLTTTLVHAESGGTISTWWPLPLEGKPQELGSALTYARRYSLGTIAGIATEDDDDGNEAQKTERVSDLGPGNEAPNGNPDPKGPLGGITKIKEKCRSVEKTLFECSDLHEVQTILFGHRDYLAAIAHFRPGWWKHDEGGLYATIQHRILTLTNGQDELDGGVRHDDLMRWLDDVGGAMT